MRESRRQSSSGVPDRKMIVGRTKSQENTYKVPYRGETRAKGTAGQREPHRIAYVTYEIFHLLRCLCCDVISLCVNKSVLCVTTIVWLYTKTIKVNSEVLFMFCHFSYKAHILVRIDPQNKCRALSLWMLVRVCGGINQSINQFICQVRQEQI